MDCDNAKFLTRKKSGDVTFHNLNVFIDNTVFCHGNDFMVSQDSEKHGLGKRVLEKKEPTDDTSKDVFSL